jgi:transcriptional regulator with XRE-family HTH domain
MTLQDVVNAQLARKGITLQAAARKMKITPHTIRNVYRGVYEPLPKTLDRLAAFLELPVETVSALADAARAAPAQAGSAAPVRPVEKAEPEPEPEPEPGAPPLLAHPVETQSGVKVRASVPAQWGCNRCPWEAACLVEVNRGYFAWCEELLEEEVLWNYEQVQFFTPDGVLVRPELDAGQPSGNVTDAQARTEAVPGIPAL